MSGVRRCRSFVANWGSRISRERFDLDSPHFTRTFKMDGSTITPDMTSLATSGWQLPKFKPWNLEVQPSELGQCGLLADHSLSGINIRIHRITAAAPVSIKPCFETVQCRCRNNLSRQTVPHIHDTITEEVLSFLGTAAPFLHFIFMTSYIWHSCFSTGQERSVSDEIFIVYASAFFWQNICRYAFLIVFLSGGYTHFNSIKKLFN